MKIAVPTSNGKLSMHFGHCDEFTLVDANIEDKSIKETKILGAPPHQPGLLPRWLHEKGVELVIAGGMGMRAQNIFNQAGIKVIVGASSKEPKILVKEYIDGELVTGNNICDH